MKKNETNHYFPSFSKKGETNIYIINLIHNTRHNKKLSERNGM